MLPNIINRIEKIIEDLGLAVAWLTLVMVLITALSVILRYGFNISYPAMQESITYMHGAVFMLGIAFALQRGAHVRVDVFYRRLHRRTQLWVDLIGGIAFLGTFTIVLFISSWDYVIHSWALLERSTESTGLPAVFLLKSLIPLLAVTLFAQGLAEVLRCALQLQGLPAPPRRGENRPTT